MQTGACPREARAGSDQGRENRHRYAPVPHWSTVRPWRRAAPVLRGDPERILPTSSVHPGEPPLRNSQEGPKLPAVDDGSGGGPGSIRAWGSLPGCPPTAGCHRSIPTCVGLTGGAGPRGSSRPVHPHVRGAHGGTSMRRSDPSGPSPRAWGSQDLAFYRVLAGRSIPTCVGLTLLGSGWTAPRSVHPHVRGAHTHWTLTHHDAPGPSPRAWGSPILGIIALAEGRSIPTCVGLTRSDAVSRPGAPVHPHVRGAHRAARSSRRSSSGPSPRAWGSPRHTPLPLNLLRSIPTCVGLTGPRRGGPG